MISSFKQPVLVGFTGTVNPGSLFPKDCAFTLVELMIVMVIIAVFATGVVVSFQGRQDIYALHAATKDLAATVGYTARQSKLNQCTYRIAFYDDLKRYRVETINYGTTIDFVPVNGRAGMIKLLPAGVQISEILSDGHTINHLPDTLTFRPDGSGFSGRIELRNRKGETMQIEVMHKTGQVHVGQ